mmetsp:Transcript_21973/g.58024  ORF Transcript_21973/g.58024 Transcript_21973/m.58024 type:complete len:249 (+) Transcript_21973:225-971(+)
MSHVRLNLLPALLPMILVHPRHPDGLVVTLHDPLSLLFLPQVQALAADLLRLLAPLGLLLGLVEEVGSPALADLPPALDRVLYQLEALPQHLPALLHPLRPVLQALRQALLLLLQALLLELYDLNLNGLGALDRGLHRRLALCRRRPPRGLLPAPPRLRPPRLLLPPRGLLLVANALLLRNLRASLHRQVVTMIFRLLALHHVEELRLQDLLVEPRRGLGERVARRELRQRVPLLQHRGQEGNATLQA